MDGHAVRVRLTGHLDPIDGRYHWQGTVFDAPAETPPRGAVPVVIDGNTVTGRCTERTQQGGYQIAGGAGGAPPFRLR